jgi:hypothetical protein
MPKELTSKQENFCKAVALEGKNYSDAYRASYNAKNMTDKQINEEACILDKNPKVARRIKELKDEIHNKTMEEYSISKAKLIEELEQIKQSSLKKEKKVAIDCIKEQGKLQGYYEDTVNLKGKLDVVKGIRDFKNRGKE